MANALDNGVIAPGNEEAVRAWDTVLFDRWKRNRQFFVDSLADLTTEVFERFPPPVGGRCIDIGCGFGDTTQLLATLVGPEGFALGTDSSPRFVAAAREEAAVAGVTNIDFQTADAQAARWDESFDYAYSRMGTQFFVAPVPAMRSIRQALKPDGRLCKIAWRRKQDSPLWSESETVVERFLSHPEQYEADTCGPGPFSLGNPETLRGILEAAGFDEIELHRRDFDYDMGDDIDLAVEALLAIGPGAELVRLNGDLGESRRPEITAAMREHCAALIRDDGSIVGQGSVWIVTARNPD